MKRCYVPLMLAFCLTGCGEKSSSPSTGTNSASNSSSVVTAPVDYLRTAVKAEHDATKTIDTASLDKAISLFNVDKGRNPKDLNELAQEKYIPQVPTPPFGTKLVYDSGSGRVSVAKE